MAELGEAELAEFVRVVVGLRMVRTYGSCYGVASTVEKPRWVPICDECGAEMLLCGGIRLTLALAGPTEDPTWHPPPMLNVRTGKAVESVEKRDLLTGFCGQE